MNNSTIPDSVERHPPSRMLRPKPCATVCDMLSTGGAKCLLLRPLTLFPGVVWLLGRLWRRKERFLATCCLSGRVVTSVSSSAIWHGQNGECRAFHSRSLCSVRRVHFSRLGNASPRREESSQALSRPFRERKGAPSVKSPWMTS